MCIDSFSFMTEMPLKLLEIHFNISNFLEDDLFLEFKVWERGSIGIDDLRDFLVADVRKALGDVFLEFFILGTPISEVPSNLQYFYFLKGHFCSSQRTTPSSLKNESRPITPVSSTPFPRPIVKKFLSEPATPAEIRARSPVTVLRNRSLNEFPIRDSRKLSRESPREISKKSHVEAMDNIEKTYETLEEYFPLNPSENRSSFIKKADTDESCIREMSSTNSDFHVVSVQEVERLLSTAGQSSGSPYEAQIDKEVEDSFTPPTGTEAEENEKEVREKKDFTWQEIEKRKRHDKQKQKIRRRFERGDAGFLHPWYV